MRPPPLASGFATLFLLSAASALQAANLKGGNGIYHVLVSDGQTSNKCGTWTAVTGPLHPAGADLELLFSVNGTPSGSSYTTLHSHQTGRNLTTASVCLPLCIVVGKPLAEPLMRDGITVGWRLTWSFVDAPLSGDGRGPQVDFVQEVSVEGPIDGTETIENSLVRETHTVVNHGPGGFRFGLRKMWDVGIDADDGPWIGACSSPEAGCDRSLSLTKNGTLDGPYPLGLIFRSSPPRAECPAGVEPNAPEGCSGPEPFVLAATTARASGLDPRPHPPELVQFNAWSPLFGECWLNDPLDAAACGVGSVADDTAFAYFFGASPQTAVKLRAGWARSFTQYLALDSATCPATIAGEPPPARPALR